jgi:hypothetical protein
LARPRSRTHSRFTDRVRFERLNDPPALAEPLANAAVRLIRRIPGSHWWPGYILVGVLLVCALGGLILFNLSLRALWSELVYSIVVTTLVLWELGRIPVIREALDHFGHPGLSVKRAFIWSAFVLVAVPVAIVHWPYDPMLLALGPLLSVVLYVRRTPGDPRWWRSPVVGAAGGIVLVLAAAALPPRIGAARAATTAPPAAAERADARALAAAVRPLLLFDEGEQRFPVDIEAVMARGDVDACREALGRDPCEPMRTPEDIDLGADYFDFEDVRGAAGGGDATAYYYRVVERPPRIYVDYWWYFTRNPTPVAPGVFCAPGFRLAGKTCHEHASDWEGVTVVLGTCPTHGRPCVMDADGERWTPVAVRYAQHEFLVSYSWRPTLERLWADVPNLAPLRPVVYVARNSHASYPARCRRKCKQFRSFLGRGVAESAHDGRLAWTANATCGDCLQPLPLTTAGEPAEWNAFDGRWGDQHCLLSGAYCDATGAPRAPPRQSRYGRPWQPGPWLCLAEPTDRASRALRRCARSQSPDHPLPN